ncbi:MAG: nucleotidyltransferase domain-containing protein [Methanosarcinales archaeon]
MNQFDLTKKYNIDFNRLLSNLLKYNPEKIFIFGSYARGDWDEFSDLDLIIIKETNKPLLERLSDLVKYLKDTPKAIDVLVYTPKEFEEMRKNNNMFIKMVFEEGAVVYDRNQR